MSHAGTGPFALATARHSSGTLQGARPAGILTQLPGALERSSKVASEYNSS